MKPFHYLRDGLFLGACFLYLLNRCWLSAILDIPFMSDYFNDLLLMPCAIPLVLWLHRKLGLRVHDAPPTAMEIGSHLLIWSMICEGFGEYFFSHVTGDVCDVIAYSVGGVVAWCWWHRDSREQSYLKLA